MDLYQISIPQAVIDAIPMEQVPALFHPPLVHFAIVLPIMIVLLELVNIIVKSGSTPEEPKGRGVSTLSFLLIVAMIVIFAAAYVSGSQDGKAAWDALDQAGQAELKEHKLIGTYLVYGSLVLLLFKFFSFAGQKARVLLLLLAIAFAAGTLMQGKDGGELVYKYGANVQALKACDDKLFDLKDDLQSCEEDAKKTEAKVPTDSVAKKEAAAEANPKMTEGEPAAKAKVEEAQEKENFDAKEKKEAFSKEAAADEKKVATPDEVKTIEKEEKGEAAKPATPAVPTDSVAKEEAAAEANPKMTEGVPAAKAAVEETESKDAFEAKMDREALAKEAKADEKKTDAKEEVAAVTAEEAKEAKAKAESFKEEAAADTKKTVTPEEVKTVESEAH
jgi:uncharacterized membrane protein